MKNSILFANQSSGSLMIDIVNAFEETGKFNKVELFAGKINIRPSVPNKSVHVIKTIEYKNSKFILRLLTWFISYIHLLFVVWFRSDDTELFLVTNPPFNTFVPLFTRKKYTLLIYDIYPDTLINQHVIGRDSFLGKLWTKRNKKAFGNAKKVFTITNEMKKVVCNYVDESKVSVVYNWTHNERMVPVNKQDNPFLKSLGLQDKFIIMYSGNMGLTHDIDVLVDVANEMKDNDAFRFIFIGEGGKKKVVEKKIAEYHLSNCLVLPFQDKDVLPYSMGAADIGVITTAREQSGLSIPSKINSFMAVGSILLCIADQNTELGHLVKDNNLGQCFPSSDIVGMRDFIDRAYSDSEYANAIKKKTREMSFNFTPENAKLFLSDN